VNQRLSHGEPCFFVRDKRPVCYYHDDHNGDGRITRCGALPLLACKRNWSATNPNDSSSRQCQRRGHSRSGWGCSSTRQVRTRLDWDEIAAILEDAFRNVAVA
jgi:hypothetical protein